MNDREKMVGRQRGVHTGVERVEVPAGRERDGCRKVLEELGR